MYKMFRDPTASWPASESDGRDVTRTEPDLLYVFESPANHVWPLSVPTTHLFCLVEQVRGFSVIACAWSSLDVNQLITPCLLQQQQVRVTVGC